MSSRFARFGLAVASVLACTVFLDQFIDHVNSTTVALTFLVCILFAATFFGRNPALAASFVAMLAFNYFFLPPVRTLTIADPQNLIAWAAFTITAIIAGELSAYAQSRGREAERLYAELQEAFDKAAHAEALERTERLKSALLDAVTHDLRTPLTSIKAASTSLMDESIALDTESRNEFLEIINEEADRLNTFIGGMVDLARVETGDMPLRKTWVSIDEIVNNSLQRAKPRIGPRHVILAKGHDLPSIHIDPVPITEVLFSLLDNAAKYSDGMSKIRVEVQRAAPEMIEFAVEDEGTGIPIEDREKVFDKFYRSGAADIHSTGGGLGLGLSIARGIVESQGGSISVEDGRGGYVTRVAFRIPIGDVE